MFNEELCTKLANGEVCLRSTGDRYMIKQILNFAFPNDSEADGGSDLYSLYGNDTWGTGNDNDLVEVDANEFFINEPHFPLIIL